MRSLGDLTTKKNYTPTIQLALTAPGGTPTYVHCLDDFISMTPIEWEIPFMGGLGKPSRYDVTLGMPLATIKDRLAHYNRAVARLTVDVSSTPFQPHVGRVRGIRRSESDPNQVTLTIVDRFLDDDPMVPVESIVNSYPNTHPQEQGAEIGWPLYYGLHHRNSYLTATDCNIQVMLWPRNVSSTNHSQLGGRLWFNSNFARGENILDDHILHAVPGIGTLGDVTSFAFPFRIFDGSSYSGRMNEWAGHLGPQETSNPVVLDTGVITRDNPDTVYGHPNITHGFVDLGGGAFRYYVDREFHPRVRSKNVPDVLQLETLGFSACFSGITFVNSYRFRAYLEPGAVLIGSASQVTSLTANFSPASGATGAYWLANSVRGSIRVVVSEYDERLIPPAVNFYPNSLDSVTCVVSIFVQVWLPSEAYRRFSVFWPVQNSADVAISTNPMGILDHVFSYHTATPYRQDQSSAAQALVNSYKLQCFFADREPLKQIMDEFGRISATYLWIGDSGTVNYRTYAPTATATVNKTVGPDDCLSGFFQLRESPLGSSIEQQDFAREFTVEFGYHIQRDAYEKTIYAGPAGNALCAAASSAGITASRTERTKVITDPNVASYYLGNLVRKYAQGNEFISWRSPPHLFDLELADVVKFGNPMIVGSQATYQIIRTRMHPIEGWADFTAAKLLAL